MKNVIFFVVLAVLTVAALVGWNAVRKQLPTGTASNVPTATPSPTGESGTGVGRNGLSDIITTPNPMASSSGSFGNSQTKGGLPLNTPTPTSVGNNTPTPTKTSQPTPTPQVGTVVTYTDNGFNPKSLTVKSGTMVKFVNTSSKRMWIQSASVSGGQALTGFDMGVNVGKDGSYEYMFTKTGTWGYQNKEDSSQQGSVVVN